MKKYLDWASREYTMRQRVTALVPLALLFLLILPLLLVRGSAKLDRKLRLPHFRAGRVNRIAGASLGVAGVSFAWWSIGSQMTVGSGTPVPMMPTQRLLVQPPFTFCRNPMTLGTIIGGLGIGVWIGSFSAIAIVGTLATALLAYIRFIEEKELEVRFGQDYVDYKRTTPFLLPRAQASRGTSLLLAKMPAATRGGPQGQISPQATHLSGR